VPLIANLVDQDSLLATLRTLTDPQAGPVLVHCMQGADRTGVVVAAYRVVAQGWPKEEAIREMRQGGFGFHEQFTNLVELLRGLDVGQMRAQLGLQDGIGRPSRGADQSPNNSR